MSWLRDNWLDALIFLLFALVVGGIVLFLTGVNPLRKSTDTSTPPAVTAPADPATATETTPPTTPEAVTPEPEPEAVTPEPEPTPTITVSPQIPAPAPKPAASPAPKPAASPTPAASSSSTGSWQVAVGAFSQAQNAQTLAQTLRKQGYEVRVSSAGNLTRVTVGPFPNEQRARSVAAALGEYGAQAVRVGATPAAAPAPTPSSPPVTVASPGNILLQVGAFRSQAGAQATLKQLQQAGYSTILVDDGSLYKVRVSVSNEARDQAKTALRQQGFEPLEVKP